MSPFALRRNMRQCGLLAALALAAPAAMPVQSASAHSYKLGALQIGHVWAKPAPKGGETIVTGPVFNTGRTEAALIAVSSPAAAKTEMRSGADAGDTPIETIAFPPGRPVSLAPWANHVVLSGLERSLTNGDTVKLTLDFGKLGRETVDVEIEAQMSE